MKAQTKKEQINLRYNRDVFIPKVTKREIIIKYNPEIYGFILIQPQLDSDIDFFSSISRKRFNDSLRSLNHQLQRRFCEKKTILSKTFFNREIFVTKISSVLLLILFLIVFFTADEEVVVKKEYYKKLMSNIWLIITIVQIIILTFFIYLFFIVARKQENYDLESKISENIETFIQQEENFYQSDGYRWTYSEKMKLLIIERNY